jgi:DNA-binding beta-propeller fold protein YncE
VIEIMALTVLAADTNYLLKPINLPSASGAVALDYFAYDRATGKLWVPASNTGSVDVIDEKTDAVSRIAGFPIGEIERRGRKITVGPTAASVGDGVIYIGNRGDATLCVIDAKSQARLECVPVSANNAVTPDGVVYVAAAREVWVTLRVKAGDSAPPKSLDILDASDPHRIIEQTDPNNFPRSSPIGTASGARTGLFVPELDTLFVAVPQRGSRSAEIRVYHVE